MVRHGRNLSTVDGKPVGVGTLDYAAPEQLLKGESSVGSDVFALGKTMRSLYGGRVPANLRSVVRRATREQPGDRYPSARAFAVAIQHRNRGRIALALFLALFGAGIALALYFRTQISGTIVRVLRPPEASALHVATRRQHEADADYFRRVLPLARAGNAVAAVAVAEAYFYGRGTPTNRMESVRWYRVAAEKGEASARASLGLCLFRGYGGVTNRTEAVHWYALAARQGDLGAMNDLAFCLLNGLGVARNASAGFAWALRAAERGHAASQTLVGECYLDGVGVEPNLERAETWLYRAARRGNRRAEILLETR